MVPSCLFAARTVDPNDARWGIVSLCLGGEGGSVGTVTSQVRKIVDIARIGVAVADDRATACAQLTRLDLLHRTSRYSSGEPSRFPAGTDCPGQDGLAIGIIAPRALTVEYERLDVWEGGRTVPCEARCRVREMSNQGSV
jgi:hypothetical protein